MLNISVIIPVYNGESYISNAVHSLTDEQLNHDVHLHIIIVDDGSTDTTPVILETLSKRYSCVTYISQKNAGTAAARNTALNKIYNQQTPNNNEWIAFLDADDSWLNGWGKLCHIVSQSDSDILGFGMKATNSNGKVDFIQPEPIRQTGGVQSIC